MTVADSPHRRKLASQCSDTGFNDDDEISLTEYRRLLAKKISDIRSPQRAYMPGISTLIDAISPTYIVESPEKVKLWLPSNLPPGSRNQSCTPGLVYLEYRLRHAQAFSSLENLRHFLRLYKALITKNRAHISSTQKTITRSWGIFGRFKRKVNKAASTYRAAYTAIEQLDPAEAFGRWKKDFKRLSVMVWYHRGR